jgi:hypothetical protein
MASVKARAACLLLLLLSTTVLQVAEAASKKEREDALSAGVSKKPQKGAGGKMKDGTRKSQKFADTLNKIQGTVGEREHSAGSIQKGAIQNICHNLRATADGVAAAASWRVGAHIAHSDWGTSIHIRASTKGLCTCAVFNCCDPPHFDAQQKRLRAGAAPQHPTPPNTCQVAVTHLLVLHG